MLALSAWRSQVHAYMWKKFQKTKIIKYSGHSKEFSQVSVMFLFLQNVQLKKFLVLLLKENISIIFERLGHLLLITQYTTPVLNPLLS